MSRNQKRMSYTLWNCPESHRANALEENGFTREIINRVISATEVIEASDISSRLQVYQTKIEESANTRLVY